jgi:hypothetical protein
VPSGVLFVHGLASDLLGNHISKDTHHCGTSVVHFNVKFAGFLLRVLDFSSKIPKTVVSVQLEGGHPYELDNGQKDKNLYKSSGGYGPYTIGSCGDIGEFQIVGGGKVSRKTNVAVVDDASNDGSHGHTSMLALHSTSTLEFLGLRLEPAKGIPDTEGFCDSNFELIDGKSRGDGPGGSGRGESGGGSDKEGRDSSQLHFGGLLGSNCKDFFAVESWLSFHGRCVAWLISENGENIMVQQATSKN